MKTGYQKRITTGDGTPATTTIVPTSCAVKQIVVSVHNAGTTWAMRIQDIASTPNVLVPQFTLAIPSTPGPEIIFFEEPVRMEAGVNIITSGTTAGEVFVWVSIVDGK